MRLFLRGLWLGCGLFAVVGAVFAYRVIAANAPPVPLDRAPYLQNVTTGEATVLWQTKTAAPTQIEWGEVGAPLRLVRGTKNATSHAFRLNGLKADTRYRYRVAGHASESQFTTAPAQATRFRFAAWGDSGSGEAGQKQLALQIARFDPAFLVHTGDLIYPRGAWRDYDPKFFSIYAPLLRSAPFYGSIGNHDNLTQKAAPWLANFVLPRNGPRGVTPERNYSFVWGNAQFWILDGNTTGTEMKRIAAWLREGIRESRATWKFAVFHQPPYSSGLHGGYNVVKKYYAPVLEDGIDIVLNGHDHTYERFAPKGTATYIVTGAGGAVRYPRRHNAPGSVFFNNKHWSFSAFTIDGAHLKAQQIAASGTVLDEWRLSK